MTAEPTVEAVPGYREGRELAALKGGPYSQFWYWRDELEFQQVRGWKADYEPTEEWVPNPDPDKRLHGVRGRVWRWTGAPS